MPSAERTDPSPVAASLAEQGLPPGFCILPFVGMHISAAGSISPCCEYAGEFGNVRTTSLGAVWISPELAALREKFLRGDAVAACWKCADRERHEGASIRIDKLQYAGLVPRDEAGGPIASAHPKYLDLRSSNLCNFRCRTCWHGASSKWYMDAKAIGAIASDQAEIRSFDDLAHFEAQIANGIDDLETIYFAGGEPLLMPEHYALLEMLIARERTDVELHYNTNLSVTELRGRSIFDLWSQFPRLEIEASIDGAGARGELIRKELDWSRFVANVTSLRRACRHVRLSFGITVSVFNILTLPDLMSALMMDCGATADSFRMHSLQVPRYYRTQVLPAASKQEAQDGIDRFLQSLQLPDGDRATLGAKLRGVVQYMHAEDCTADIAQFERMTGKLDKLREERVGEIFPELAPLLSGRLWIWPRLRRFAGRVLKLVSGRSRMQR